jgi:hypothetical protein
MIIHSLYTRYGQEQRDPTDWTTPELHSSW